MRTRTTARRPRRPRTDGKVIPCLASGAALAPGTFGAITAKSAIPPLWEDRARKAVEYYQEEPLVSNAINAWRIFALGDEITITCDN